MARMEISIDQFLHDLRSVRDFTPSWSYAWVLGSGAAVGSGIPTGRTLASRWLREIYEIKHRDAAGDDLKRWDAATELGLAGLAVDEPAAFYGSLYRLRFGHQPRIGQEFLRSQIRSKAPSYGYSALAQIQRDTPHRYVVTTNFDHLLEESHKRYLDCELVVCASDDQASTLQRLPDEPLLAKIHGDIFHETKNDAHYIAELRDLWHDPLRSLFKRSAPIFIGYGGNDPGFMAFLARGVRPGWFPHKPIWTYREADGCPTGDLVQQLQGAHDMIFLPIPGFDEFLFLVAEALELKPLTKWLEADFALRVRRYRDSYEAMAASLRKANPGAAEPGGALDRSLGPPELRTWWDWSEAARNAGSFEGGLKVLDEALVHLPSSPELKSFIASYRAVEDPRDPESERIARDALVDAQRQYGEEHPGTLSCLIHLAAILSGKNKWTEAEDLYRLALARRERVLGPDHPDTLVTLSDLGRVLREKGDPAGAEILLAQAFEKLDRVLGADHPYTLLSGNNLANLLADRGETGRAEALYRRAYESQRRNRGPDHPVTLTSMSNLAIVLVQLKQTDAAEELFRQVLRARERVLTLDHPDVLTSMSNLAHCLEMKGRFADAERLLRRVLAARRRRLGGNHSATLRSMNGLAQVLSARKQYAPAERMTRRAADGQRKLLGKEHPDTLYTTSCLARILAARGRHDDAASLLRTVLRAQTRIFGKEHVDTISTANELGDLLAKCAASRRSRRRARPSARATRPTKAG